MSIIMDIFMKSKIRFYQEYFRANFEADDCHLLLIECLDDIPIRTYIIQIPKIDVRFSINPYILN